MNEILYDICLKDGFFSYRVEKETTEQNISIIVFNTFSGKNKEIGRITYKNIGEEYFHPFINWYNLIFCSNNYNAVDKGYMHSAVQEGKKTAATVYLEPNSREGKRLVKKLPSSCAAMEYDKYLFVYHKGCLADFFDLEKIRSLYRRHGVLGVDWSIIQNWFQKDLSFFGDEETCGFSLQSGGDGFKTEQIIIIGLLLGYPIESTVEWLL